jgi:hypothetical protein
MQFPAIAISQTSTFGELERTESAASEFGVPSKLKKPPNY